MKLNIKAFALTSGIIWGVGLFFLTWWIIAFEGVTHQATIIGQLYRGYSISPLGSVIGLVWGFFDALVGGALFAWLYNLIAAHCASPRMGEAHDAPKSPAVGIGPSKMVTH